MFELVLRGVAIPQVRTDLITNKGLVTVLNQLKNTNINNIL